MNLDLGFIYNIEINKKYAALIFSDSRGILKYEFITAYLLFYTLIATIPYPLSVWKV